MPDFANDNDRNAPRPSPKAEAGDEIAGGTCPICGKPRLHAWRPFCSKRCADVDLARWLGGNYAIPARPGEDGDGQEH